MESGWLNPPLRFQDEPCRHKMVDLLGDVSLCARNGNPAFPLGHIIAYKAGHSLHVKFSKALSQRIRDEEQETQADIRNSAPAKTINGTLKRYFHTETGPYTMSKRYVHTVREPTSLVNVLHQVRHRQKRKELPPPQALELADVQVVKGALTTLNGIVYMEELPERLVQYKGLLSSRDIAMVIKLVPDVKLAFEFFIWVKDQGKCDVDVVLTMVHRLLGARMWDDLNNVVDWLHEKGFYLHYGLFEAVIKAASTASQIDVCEKWYKLMLEINVKPQVFVSNLMIRVYNKHARYSDSLRVFEVMEANKIKPTVVTYSQLFTACKDLGDAQTLKILLKKMKVQGVRLDQMGFATLMNVYAKAGEAEQAEVIFKGMHEQGVEPDIVLLNCLLEAYVKADLSDKAGTLFRELPAYGCKANEATYVIMLGLFCKTGMYDEAAEMLQTVDDRTVRLGEQFYITLIKSYAAGEQWDRAMQVFKKMEETQGRIRGSVYVLMQEVTFRAGDFEACEQMFIAIIDKGINRTPAVYETMMQAYEKMDKVAKVCELFLFMQDMLCPFTWRVYNYLNEVFSRTGNNEMLERLVMVKEAGKVFDD